MNKTKRIPRGRPKTGKPLKKYEKIDLEIPVSYMFRQMARKAKKTYSQFQLELLELYRKSKLT